VTLAALTILGCGAKVAVDQAATRSGGAGGTGGAGCGCAAPLCPAGCIQASGSTVQGMSFSQ
jgi:hypothetical protein